MKHIIIVGDSFSDENRENTIFNYNDLKPTTLDRLLTPGTLKLGTLTSLDIINQNKENDIVLHILGKGSAGNHYISEKLFDEVLKIKEEESNPDIYAIIQLSAFFRNSENLKNNIRDIDIEKYPYDYYDQKRILDYGDLKNNYIKHLDNILDINNFCETNNVQKIIFFGWSTIYDEDINLFKLENRIESIKKIVTFFPYDDDYDEMESYCAGNKIIKKIINNNKLYLVKSNNFGGMTDFIRKTVPVGERYIMSYDPHLTSKSNVVFYNMIIKPWLIKNNILNDLGLPNNLLDSFDLIYGIEKLKYDIFFNTTPDKHSEIRELMYKLFKHNVKDLNIFRDSFKELASNMGHFKVI